MITRRLQHPNAVRVEDLDATEDGRPFIVMEYVDGRSLRELVRSDGPQPLARAVSVARQVCAALAAPRTRWASRTATSSPTTSCSAAGRTGPST